LLESQALEKVIQRRTGPEAANLLDLSLESHSRWSQSMRLRADARRSAIGTRSIAALRVDSLAMGE
jgi:hypothetical protein